MYVWPPFGAFFESLVRADGSSTLSRLPQAAARLCGSFQIGQLHTRTCGPSFLVGLQHPVDRSLVLLEKLHSTSSSFSTCT